MPLNTITLKEATVGLEAMSMAHKRMVQTIIAGMMTTRDGSMIMGGVMMQNWAVRVVRNPYRTLISSAGGGRFGRAYLLPLLSFIRLDVD